MASLHSCNMHKSRRPRYGSANFTSVFLRWDMRKTKAIESESRLGPIGRNDPAFTLNTNIKLFCKKCDFQHHHGVLYEYVGFRGGIPRLDYIAVDIEGDRNIRAALRPHIVR